MKRNFIVCIVVAISLICSALPLPVCASEEYDELSPYYTALEDINAQLGISYAFPTEEELEENGENYSDLVAFFTAMSIEEFKSYVLEAYENEKNENADLLGENTEVIQDPISLLSYTKTQKYYYSTSNSNYISITSTLYTGDGKERYSKVSDYSYDFTEYPYYKPSSLTTSFGSGYTSVTCTFKCSKYVAKNIINTATYTIKVTFPASGGNVYATITV